VKAFAERAHTELARLDVLVANAGIHPGRYEKTEDGWETW
jgi:NAD(P)-dependent dehydrogenase (short-subunit alcohol dehydrogenase family)